MAYSFGTIDDFTEFNESPTRDPDLSFSNYHPSQTSQSAPSNGTTAKIHNKKFRSPFKTNGNAANGRHGEYRGEQRFDVRFKVLLLGNSGVGKTSLLKALMGEPFNPGTISTIGIDLNKKIFTVDNNRIQLEVWDTAGQEQYFSIVSFHFRQVKAFIVVYDVTSPETFEQIRKYWLHTIDEHMNETVPVFFAANKADLPASSWRVSSETGKQLAEQQCAHGYFETSAKSGQNVQELFQRVAESMVSTWGAPKRWYEVDGNGHAISQWPNQYPERQTLNLYPQEDKPPRSKCCVIK